MSTTPNTPAHTQAGRRLRSGYRAASVTLGVTGLVLLSALPASAAPDPSPQLPGALDEKMNSLLGILMALVIFACVAGFLLVAGKMALALRRGEGGEAVGQLGVVAAACVLVGSAATIVTWLMA